MTNNFTNSLTQITKKPRELYIRVRLFLKGIFTWATVWNTKWFRKNVHNKGFYQTAQMVQFLRSLTLIFFPYLYTLYVVEGRTVTPLLHKLFLGELHRYYSGYNLMLYPPPYTRSLPHSRFYCHFVFSVKSDCIRVMGARPSLLFCSLLLCKYRSKCIVSSDWSRWWEQNSLSSCID